MSFENIIGQHRAIRAIENIISQGQLRGSYLFLGPDGVGKRTVALELAKAINCEAPLETKDTCSCASCKKITSGNHPDVFLISPEGASYSIKIAKVRDIIYQASLKPYEGKKRVFIIDDALEMTEEAQNALLKVLEEPPERHIFILVASKVAGFLPTVISRCRILKFHPVKQSEIQDFLKNRDVDEDGAVLFSHMAMGSIGRALEYIEGDIIPRREQVVNDFFLR
ncbi:MAG: DNA polymerase III subunit delta', partial [Candidatus Omnitrophota bacterium]|nr:DNA polymerase III subunit delta' [Candidatus Omnitrophota bacterium]